MQDNCHSIQLSLCQGAESIKVSKHNEEIYAHLGPCSISLD